MEKLLLCMVHLIIKSVESGYNFEPNKSSSLELLYVKKWFDQLRTTLTLALAIKLIFPLNMLKPANAHVENNLF